MIRRTVEEILRRAEDAAALARYIAASAMINPESPTAAVWSGLEDVCDEIETSLRAVRRALQSPATMDALNADVSHCRQPSG